MKSIKYILWTVILMIVILGSCTRQVSPSFTGRIRGYDSLAFDRIYVEAIKLKITGNNGEALKYFEQCA